MLVVVLAGTVVVVDDVVVVVGPPVETNSVTVELTGTWLPAGGSVRVTSPEGTEVEGSFACCT